MEQSANTLKIYETFKSIQGESTQAGRLCFFIRLTTCNLKCSYCDTIYAQDDSSAKIYSINELLELCHKSNCKLIELTGGEPLLQAPMLNKLIDLLLQDDFEVMLETNGSCDINQVSSKVKRILDCKLPSSNMSDFNNYQNYDCLTSHDEVKFVIANKNDFEFASKVISDYNLTNKTKNLLASPVWGAITFEELAELLIKNNSPMRMQVQLHKIVWGDKSGV